MFFTYIAAVLMQPPVEQVDMPYIETRSERRERLRHERRARREGVSQIILIPFPDLTPPPPPAPPPPRFDVVYNSGLGTVEVTCEAACELRAEVVPPASPWVTLTIDGEVTTLSQQEPTTLYRSTGPVRATHFVIIAGGNVHFSARTAP